MAEQAQEIERMRAALDKEHQAHIVGERQAAVLAARLEAAQTQLAQAENRGQAVDVQLATVVGELSEAHKETLAMGLDAKKHAEEAAELRGKFAMLGIVKGEKQILENDLEPRI